MILQKQFRLGMLLLATAIISFTACSDDDDDTAPAAGGGTGGGGNNAAEMMSVKIDGTSKTFDSVFGVNVFGTITLIGSDNSASGYPQITISMPDSLPTGTYNYPATFIPTITYIPDTVSLYFRTSGSITIATNDTVNDLVVGTFNVDMTDATNSSNTISLTEGKFNISY